MATAGAVGFGAMAISAIKMLEDGTLQASAATYAYKQSLKGVTNGWQKIISLNADSIFGALSSALNGVRTTLKNLTPFLKGVSEAVNSTAQNFEKWVSSSSTAKKAFETMNTSGVKVFSSLLSAAGRFGDGLVNILTQFAPLFEFVANGLNNMGASFQEWANKVSTQQGIQKFIDYVKVNLPIIGKIFGDTFLGIFNLFKAFGSNSQTIFEALAQMASKFRAWSEQVAQSDGFKKFIDYVQQNGPTIMSLIGNIIMVLVNFGTAMAPIASVVLNVVTAITGFVAKLFETHPIVAQIIGLAITFGGVLMTWIPIIVGIVSYLAPLIARFGFLKTSMLLLSRVFTLLSGPIGIVSKLFPILGAAIGFLTSPIGLVIGAIIALIAIFVILWNKNEAFRNFIINLWNSIKDFFINLWTTLATIASVLWQLLLTTIVKIIISIQMWLTTTWQNILTFLSTLWNTLIVIATTIWNLLVTVIVTVITTILTIQQAVWNAILSFLQTIWNTVVSVATTVWNTLVTVITTVLNAINSFVTLIWNAIYSFFASILSRISSTVSQKFSEVYRWISTKIQQAYSILSSILSNMWSVVSSKFSQIVSTVISKMVEFYNAIKQKVQDSLNAVVNFVGEFMDAGRNLIMGLVNGVKNAAGALIDAVTGAVSGAIDKAKADTARFKKAIDSAIRTLRQYEKITSRIKDVELDADDKLIKEKVKQAELALKRIDGKKSNATIDASTKIAETKLKNYEKALQFLDNKLVKTAIDLQNRLFVSKFNKTKAEINKLDGKTVNTELEVKDSVAVNKIRRFKALLRSIPNRRKVRVDADGNSFLRALDYLNKQSDVFVGRMDRIAKSIRTFGTIGANMIQGTLLSSFSALIPIIASLVPAIMAVGNALAVVGGGALGLAGAFGIKSLLGIKSPSRVFKQIGVYTMQGLGIGVDQEGQNAVGSVVDVARQLTKAFNPVLSLPSISDATSGLNGLSGLSANLTTQIQHTHSFETSPRMKTVRIEMRLDNDAIYGIVNDKQAEKHSIFEM
ncbi:putative tail length tape-measure protein [Staphylococcus virus pSp_SNUABM-S]|nr:putative tail length tape-measure protein [Staphylococcus virus pSp_SNUABM-S]